MSKLIILNTREIKKIKELLISNFSFSLPKNYVYLRNDKGKIYIINKQLSEVDLNKLKIDRIGLYFAELKHNQLRLSKEGAQLLAQEAEKSNEELKNVVELTKEEFKKYFLGQDLIKDLGEDNRLILLKFGKNVFGCAKYKEGKILNFLPKIHRGEVII
jgi:NOL1/NOP2/fmu family ribosome biogenesis protein